MAKVKFDLGAIVKNVHGALDPESKLHQIKKKILLVIEQID